MAHFGFLKHRTFHVLGNKYYVETEFDPAELLIRGDEAIVTLVFNRVIEAVAEPLVKIMEPLFRQVLLETLKEIQEQIDADRPKETPDRPEVTAETARGPVQDPTEGPAWGAKNDQAN